MTSVPAETFGNASACPNLGNPMITYATVMWFNTWTVLLIFPLIALSTVEKGVEITFFGVILIFVSLE